MKTKHLRTFKRAKSMPHSCLLLYVLSCCDSSRLWLPVHLYPASSLLKGINVHQEWLSMSSSLKGMPFPFILSSGPTTAALSGHLAVCQALLQCSYAKGLRCSYSVFPKISGVSAIRLSTLWMKKQKQEVEEQTEAPEPQPYLLPSRARMETLVGHQHTPRRNRRGI